MNDDRRDELHDASLSELYRETRTVDPPAWLDRGILDAARSAVAPRPPSRLKPRNSRWRVPLALAATVVLTAGVLRMADEAGEFRLYSAPAQSKIESAAKAESAAPGNTRPLPAERDRSAASEASSRAAVLSAEVPPPAPAIPSQDAIKEEMLSGSLAQPAVPAAAAPAAAPAKPAASQPQAPVFEAKKEDRLKQSAPMESPARRELRADRSPEQWLEDINQLRRQGRTAEADARLAEFRRRYPHYPLDALESPR
ncbi:MAG: hypothetical protein JNM60_09185 [Candidatus Competibacteraceae bacterium]|nr:hypothetical protein [Candidatus Competibacteraceae bacterium]